jgi:2-dehydropantoate 2-reductase
MPHIAVIGPGAIGGTVAAWLARDADNVMTVCARTPFDQLDIDTPNGALTASPIVLTASEQAVAVDWILIATKAYDVASVAPWLRALSGPGTRVAVLQNGVEHVQRFAPYADVASLVPVVVDMPAQRVSPGRIQQRGDGKLTVADDANGRDFARLFANTGFAVVTVADFNTQAWRKLALNCAGAVSAATLRPTGIAANEKVGDIMRALSLECIAVARAQGAEIDDSWADEVLAIYRASPPDLIDSLHADRRAGRPLEIDARNGAVVRIGRRHGIATPVNEIIVTLLEAAAGMM